jgi:diguanylate cyclase (GGDEF)-like protein
MLPFAGATGLGLVLGLVPDARTNVHEVVASVALTVVVIGAAIALPWGRLPAWAQAVPPFAYLLAVALLRDGAGGAASGFGPLLLLPVFWLALYGSALQLGAVLVGVGAVYYVPMLVIGGAAYPVSGWRAGALYVVVAAIVGFTVQGLIRRLRAVLAERADLLARLERLAGTDPLTGLANRRAWDEALERALADAHASGRPLAVAVLDLDRFKRINDRHGHQHGDRVLRDSAAAWLPEVRAADLLARIGGEEFGVLLTDCPLDGAVSVIERMRAATPSGQTCSAGVVQWDRAETAAALLARADRMLYRAKQQGRDRSVAEDPAVLRAA